VTGNGGKLCRHTTLSDINHIIITNIKIDLREIGCESNNWIQLTRDMGSYEHGNEPSCSIKGGKYLHQLGSTLKASRAVRQ
jgi:hypothetical protein